MRKIIEYTLVSADVVIEDAQNWALTNTQDDSCPRDGLDQPPTSDAMLVDRHTRAAISVAYARVTAVTCT